MDAEADLDADAEAAGGAAADEPDGCDVPVWRGATVKLAADGPGAAEMLEMGLIIIFFAFGQLNPTLN